jgi:hypothetical protein
MTAGSSDRGLVEVVIWFGAAVLVLILVIMVWVSRRHHVA